MFFFIEAKHIFGKRRQHLQILTPTKNMNRVVQYILTTSGRTYIFLKLIIRINSFFNQSYTADVKLISNNDEKKLTPILRNQIFSLPYWH